MHPNVLEDGAHRQLRKDAPEGSSRELVGTSCAGGAHQHSSALWKNHQRLDVCSGDALRRSGRRAQHLQHVQAHLAETAPRRRQVLLRDLPAGPQEAQLPRAPAEYGGNRALRARGRARRAHRELVPEQGLLPSHFNDLCCAIMYCNTHTHTHHRFCSLMVKAPLL